MNWIFTDFKILRSEKIGHAHGKSKCLPDNSCDGSFLYYHIKQKAAIAFPKTGLMLIAARLCEGRIESALFSC